MEKNRAKRLPPEMDPDRMTAYAGEDDPGSPATAEIDESPRQQRDEEPQEEEMYIFPGDSGE